MSENYVIRQGDCLSNLAFERGFLWQTIWEHPNNAALRNKRKDPNILLPGDVLFIPDREIREDDAETERRHHFVLKGAPAKLRLRILEHEIEEMPPSQNSSRDVGNPADCLNPVYESAPENGARLRLRPRVRVPFVLAIDGRFTRGETDHDGRINVPIPPNAGRGRLTLEPGTVREKDFEINLGHLNPLAEVSGVKQRLKNLGFDPGAIGDEEDAAFGFAIESFQTKHEQQPTGVLDEETRRKILEVHGS